MLARIAINVLACWFIACGARAADWPQLRGPTLNGQSNERLADQWPDSGPAVVWQRSLGQGYSAFVVVGNQAFTQTQSAFGQMVVCLDASNGETIWEHRYAAPYEPLGIYPGPRSTPSVTNGRVYFVTPDCEMGCLNANSGRPIWFRHLQQE